LIIVRNSSFKTTPWKNGGGVTHEALRMPPQGDPFRWRISVAEVAASGPFSDFSGYHRSMTLLRGAGLDLKFTDGRRIRLSGVGDLAEFDGADAPHCDLLAGPCSDLNLIVTRAIADPKLRVAPLDQPLAVHSLAGEVLVVFAICGGLRLRAPSGQTEVLSTWDLAVVTQPSAFDTMLEPQGDAAPARVFLANFTDA
jgi:environmental stress-induced protein Ves